MAFAAPPVTLGSLSWHAASPPHDQARARRVSRPPSRRVRMAAPGVEGKPVPGKSRFCSACAAPMAWTVPKDDTQERLACSDPACGTVLYRNPVVTVASVVTSADRKRVLLARRAIAPFIGSWNLPGGFLECDETIQEAARRECREETNASTYIVDLLALYDIVAAAQVQCVVSSVLLNEPELAAGVESQEVKMFAWSDVPWDEILLTTHKWGLLRMLNNTNVLAPGDPVVPELRTKPVSYKDPE
jgi:ADP-ribose pyrophosphatase YjhB (NUDIX family)